MSVEQVIKALESAQSPSRSLDVAIAIAIGYRQVTRKSPDEPTKTVNAWLLPGSDEIGRIPWYTSSLHHAMELARSIEPSQVGAFTWGRGVGKARINDGPPFEACNPQIAICLAALHCLMDKQKKRGLPSLTPK